MKAVIYELIIARVLINTVMSDGAAAVGAVAPMKHGARGRLLFLSARAPAAVRIGEETGRDIVRYSAMRLPAGGGGIHLRCPHLLRNDARQLILLRTKQIGNARKQPQAPAPKTREETHLPSMSHAPADLMHRTRARRWVATHRILFRMYIPNLLLCFWSHRFCFLLWFVLADI